MEITLYSTPYPGYTWEGMTKISYKKALARFNENREVFLLYDDGTEGRAEDVESLEAHHGYSGEFGYEN
jgi:hypothetical protein